MVCPFGYNPLSVPILIYPLLNEAGSGERPLPACNHARSGSRMPIAFVRARAASVTKTGRTSRPEGATGTVGRSITVARLPEHHNLPQAHRLTCGRSVCMYKYLPPRFDVHLNHLVRMRAPSRLAAAGTAGEICGYEVNKTQPECAYELRYVAEW